MARILPMMALFAALGCFASLSSAAEWKRVEYNHPGLVVDLGVGLWAWPLPLDYDGDGDLDLVVSCPDVPYGGTYFFENPGGKKLPVFKPGVRVAPGMRNVGVSYVGGKPRLLTPGRELTGVLSGDWKAGRPIPAKRVVHPGGRVRANQWSYADYDGDGAVDLIVGEGFWGDYGWDDAFNAKGEWTRGPLHGYVYVARNRGTNAQPKYAEPAPIQAGGKAVDVFGMPSPNFADFDGDGDLDLLCGEFLDGFTYLQNIGSRQQPKYAAGRRLARGETSLKMHLCMIVVVAVDWDGDSDVDLVVGQEDGRVALVEHTGNVQDGLPVFAEPQFFQQQAKHVKFGALVTPVSFDWDGDGDEDLICGNSAGEMAFIENLDGGHPPKWAAARLLNVDGRPLRILAGPNGSIQGPAEAKWGYTTFDVADWDHDELPDLVVNSIWGKVVWYRNIGTRTKPKLAAAQPIQVEWDGPAPYPAWNWWKPADGQLVTQWRTTPAVVDWDRDGLRDLVMLDHEGYLALFRRARREGRLVLLPGERIFAGGNYDAKHRAAGKGDLLRLNTGSAGASGRRKLCVADYDGDGRRDLLVNSQNANWLRNQGERDGKILFEDRGPLSKQRLAGHTTSPTTVDWDGNGTRDLLLGAEDGFLYYLPNPHPPQASQKKPTTTRTAARRAQPTARQERLNVLFIAVDDLRVELGCYGNTIVKSPNIDRLAARGTLFTQAYCQQAVCNPSRASLLTGLRLDTLNIWDLPTHFRQRRPNVVTLPQWFKQHGYFTQNIGKIFHNWRQDKYKGDPASWSVPAVMHYATHGSDEPKVSGKLPPDQSNVPRTENRDVPDEAYFDGRIAAQAVAALRKLKERPEPFFLAVGFWKPHAPFNAPQKYWDRYDRADIAPPDHPHPPKNVPDIALHDSREILRGFRNRKGGKPTPAEVLALRHGYYAATSFADAQIGKVLDELDRLQLREKTVIVFWSDHGFHLGEHALWAKTSNFELDARVPLIIAAPQHKGGQRTDALAELLDLYPTLADLCGLPQPKEAEGVSLRPVLADPQANVKPAAFTQHCRPAYPQEGKNPEAMGYSMRTDRYRYTEWRRFTDGQVLARELYDHQSDPGETVNLAEDAAHAETIERLARLMERTIARKPVGAPR